jgi:hypothetical protein
VKIFVQDAGVAALLCFNYLSRSGSGIIAESDKYLFGKKVKSPSVPGGFMKSNIFPYRIGFWTLVVIVLLVAGVK